jgi:hypothetical protein
MGGRTMKARIKATGEIVDLAPYTRVCEDFAKGRSWLVEELDDADDVPYYWTRLEHQYAGMAMQGLMTILPNIGGMEGRTPKDEIIDIATETAHALVEKMKEERK